MEKLSKKMKRIMRMAVILFIIALILIIVFLLILKYQVEGEKNMPFQIGKIMVISTAEGVPKGENEANWNLDIVQNNDIYIQIDKNKNYKETEIINSIILDNFNMTSKNKKGEVKIYRPSSNEEKTYEYLDEDIIKEKLTYAGSEQTNIKNLEIANQGGMILLRYSIQDLGEYTSTEETEIRHDGTLLAKKDISIEEIQCEISFDVTIVLESGISYKGTIQLKLPSGNLIEEGTSSLEITDFNDVVFKRI